MVNLGSMPGYGIQSLLKEGHRHLSGLEEAVLKNIEACRELAVITRTSYGPNGEPPPPLPAPSRRARLVLLFTTSVRGLELLERSSDRARL
jgi:hypothetical protein